MSQTLISLPPGSSGGFTSAYQRTGLIRSLIRACEIRVADLEARLSEIILGVEGGDIVTGLAVQDDENVIRTELFIARSEEGFLRQEEGVWVEIVKANRKSEKETAGLATNS